MSLSEKHREELEVESGISPEVIQERGYRTVEKARDIDRWFPASQARLVPALLLPIHGTTGERVLYQLKPDDPRLDSKGRKPLKYETPAGSSARVDVPPRVLPLIGDPTVPLFITEGVKKADSAASRGLACIDVLGVANWRGQNDYGGLTALADWEMVAFKSRTAPRDVFIVYDSDVMVKREVYRQLGRLRDFATLRGAKVWLIYLPHGANGKKQGLDDWFVGGGKAEELFSMGEREMRPLPNLGRGDDEEGVDHDAMIRRRYRVSPEGLWLTGGRGGDEPCTNFTCVIKRVITRDDGETRQVFLEVDARRNCHRFQGTLTLEEFMEMKWPAERLMLSAEVLPSVRDGRKHAAFGFRLWSDPEEVSQRIHTGWAQHGEEVYYLHADGAIGAAGSTNSILVEPPHGLDRYRLPEPPDLETEDGRVQLREAIWRSLSFLEIADLDMTWPLLTAAYTAPLATLLPADFTLWLRGTTGSQKSTTAGLLLRHFGKFDRSKLPANLKSTANAVEIQSFYAKDTLFVVDDYLPAPDRRTAQQQEAVVHRLLRGVGDSQGRARATKTSGLQDLKNPRGLVLVTSELPVPGSEGTIGRTLEIPWNKQRIDLARLDQAVKKDAPFYGVAMAAYIRYLAGMIGGDLARFREQLELEWTELRSELLLKAPTGGHSRLPEAQAKLLVGVRLFLRFAQDAGAIEPEQAQGLMEQASQALARCAHRTAKGQESRKPTTIFLEALRALLNGGNVYLADRTAGGKPAEQAARWGWIDIRGGERTIRPNAEKIGWVDLRNEKAFLMPENTFRAVAKWVGSGDGMPFPGTKESLAEALDDEGLLHRPKKGRVCYLTMEAGIGGGQEPVWALPLEVIRPKSEDADLTLPLAFDGPAESRPEAGAEPAPEPEK